MLRENLGQECRMETGEAVLCQRGRGPSCNRESWLGTAAGGQSAADQGGVWQVQAARDPV